MGKNILRQIFFDKNQHWEAFRKKHHAKIRPIVSKEVEKFRDCGDIKKDLSCLYVKDVGEKCIQSIII